ncbi:hypothetical protein [Chitinophaga lutea]|uniref:hypothetical protein n=1 Tax=Chitinophaga lutea TaxID=2488634 RepID=UPI000F511DD1|nr:hypothetical protein [Chitinophaga lutea]
MRSILTFLVVVCGIVLMHASGIKLPDNPTPFNAKSGAAELAIPGSSPKLPAPEATEALVYMPDSLFQSYRGDHNLYVTNHYHVLYVKTDSSFLTPQGPVVRSRIVATNLLYR